MSDRYWLQRSGVSVEVAAAETDEWNIHNGHTARHVAYVERWNGEPPRLEQFCAECGGLSFTAAELRELADLLDQAAPMLWPDITPKETR